MYYIVNCSSWILCIGPQTRPIPPTVYPKPTLLHQTVSSPPPTVYPKPIPRHQTVSSPPPTVYPKPTPRHQTVSSPPPTVYPKPTPRHQTVSSPPPAVYPKPTPHHRTISTPQLHKSYMHITCHQPTIPSQPSSPLPPHAYDTSKCYSLYVRSAHGIVG